MALQRAVMRRVGIVVVGTMIAALTLPLFVPMWQSELGRTFCYPLRGPVQRFNPDLSDSLLARVRAHEQAHADQCRRDGALWHNLRRLVPSERLQAEAEAYCAEVRFGLANGGQARIVYPRALDELREMAWFRRFPTVQLEAALAAQCPTIAEQAAREDVEWQTRRARRSGAGTTPTPR